MAMSKFMDMCHRSLWVLLALRLFSAPTVLWAAGGTEAASFLDIPVGAGPAALGSAYTALAADAYAPVWNPAGLGFVDTTQVAAQHLAYLESIYDEYLGAAFKIKKGSALGVSAQYLGTGNIAGSDFNGNAQGSYSSYFGSYNLAYGQKVLDKLSVGLTGKVINAKIADVASTAYAADLGALYKVADHATLAATLTNLGTKLKFLNDDSSLPMQGHLAAAYAPDSHWLASLEGVFPKSGPAGARIGLQWSPVDMIAIRAGYKTDTTKDLGAMAGMTVGAGLKVWGQELAYAWLPYGDLGNTQYFSFVMRFGESEKANENLIRGQEIKYHRTVSKGKEDPEGQQLMEILNSGDEQTAQKNGSPQEPTR